MDSNLLLSLFLPAALGIIMLGLGLSLTVADFTRVVKFPKPIIVALICQVVLLPLVCFFIAKVFDLVPALAVGMMLLAASPGGPSANLYSHLAGGDVALNISLTAISSLTAIVTMPLIVMLSLDYFMAANQAIPLQFSKVLQVFAIVLGPVAIGMWVRRQFADFAVRMDQPVKIASALFLGLIIILALVADWHTVVTYAPQIGLAALTFSVASLLVGYWVPRLFQLSLPQSIAIGMEIGIHNSSIAIALAMSPALLNDPTMAIPAAIYSFCIFFTAAVFAWLVNSQHGKALAAAAT